MNGAESLVRTLVAGGVDVCFTNPGTSEMHFVAALDKVDGMRCILCLFEGGATGAADGYARMAEKPGSTLLHLGPGLGNGIANLHNAKRAQTPMVNIVGEHATYHRAYDAPLTSDIEGLARPVSGWVRTAMDSRIVASDGAAAIAAARTPPGQVATLILPADTAWNPGNGIAAVPEVAPEMAVDGATIDAAARILRSGEPSLILLGGKALRAEALGLAGRIAAKTGARLMAPTSNARMARGAGRTALDRVPYPVDQALTVLKEFRHVILVSARPPVAFFGYPGKPSVLTPPGCDIQTLATAHHDVRAALVALADAVGAAKVPPPVGDAVRPAVPTGGAIAPDAVAAALGSLLPEDAIVCDESVTTGRGFFPQTRAAPPHDWLQLTGGAIGLGIPLATGAAVACPGRKVISLEADGSGMYTLQALWTQARYGLNVLTLIWANRSYAILRGELASVGAQNPGPKALDMLSLGNPDLNWVQLAKGMGVEARRATTVDELVSTFRAGVAAEGPFLVEVMI
ncbi:MAG TPA: acetolactate synthase large subunit [Alphaproteobacteria bacterium]|nr:acetolactate synthase large subunit [Alphaproteobacteria bacterium]